MCIQICASTYFLLVCSMLFLRNEHLQSTSAQDGVKWRYCNVNVLSPEFSEYWNCVKLHISDINPFSCDQSSLNVPRSLIFYSIVIVMGAHHVEHGHKLSNYEASFLPLYHTKRGYMAIGEGWIYSKSLQWAKQAAFCSLFMPVIIKICVFSFVYSASLVETTCGLFPIFRWSGVPTRAARTQYWNWPFFLGRQPANTACNSLVDLLFSVYTWKY